MPVILSDNEQQAATMAELRREVDRQRQRIQELEERIVYLTAVLDNLPMGVAVNSVDPAVSFAYVNDAFCRIYRTTREQLTDDDAFWAAAYEEPAFREEMRQRVLADCASGDPEKMVWADVPITRQGEATRYVYARNIPVPHKDLMISTVRDVTERKTAVDALRIARDRMQRFIDSNVVGVVIATADGKVLEANDYYLNIIGCTREEFVSGKVDWRAITPAEWLAADEKAIAELRRDGKSAPYEKEYARRDGARAQVFLAITMLPGPGEEIAAFVFDIGEPKRVERALRESERKFRQIVVNLDEGFYVASLDGVLLDHNQAFSHMLGYDESANLRGLYLPDYWQDAGARECYVTALKETGTVKSLPIEIKTKTGEPIHVLVSSHLERDEDGRPLRIEGVFLDVTDRIRIERSLKRHADRLHNLHGIDQAILQAMESPEIIVATTLDYLMGVLDCHVVVVGLFDGGRQTMQLFEIGGGDGTSTKAGDAGRRVVKTTENAFQLAAAEVVEDVRPAHSPSPAARLMQTRNVLSYVALPLISARGFYGTLMVGWRDARAIPAEDVEIAQEVAGQITLAIQHSLLLDETRRHADELEKRVAERTAQLKEANDDLEAFAYSVSHDLRTPLRAIDGFTRILLEEYGPELDAEGQRVCAVISDSANDMGRLIDDLLSFSRVGRTTLEPATIDMAAVARSVYLDLTTPAERERIEFHIDDLPLVQADPVLIHQVWSNLLSNAIKFSSKKDRALIEVFAEQEGGAAVYVVRDNGAGFDMRYADKLFGVFQRLHSAMEFEGTGVGLAIVQRIIQRHGGRVWAAGETGKGATVRFTVKGLESHRRNGLFR